jgi:UDPglucose 6-dehydrogenase
MNDYQKHRFSRRIVSTLFNTVRGKQIAIFGFAFKKDTNDTRESAAIYVCRDLLEEGAELAIFDPEVEDAQIRSDLGVDRSDSRVRLYRKPQQAAAGAHAVALLTEWDCLKADQTDYQEIFSKMEKPAFLFDGRNLLDLTAMRAIGFEAYGIGK